MYFAEARWTIGRIFGANLQRLVRLVVVEWAGWPEFHHRSLQSPESGQSVIPMPGGPRSTSCSQDGD